MHVRDGRRRLLLPHARLWVRRPDARRQYMVQIDSCDVGDARALLARLIHAVRPHLHSCDWVQAWREGGKGPKPKHARALHTRLVDAVRPRLRSYGRQTGCRERGQGGKRLGALRARVPCMKGEKGGKAAWCLAR
eukprot:60585-Chlamydomonas_euryale.AAC.1